jgi:hypothetical protein
LENVTAGDPFEGNLFKTVIKTGHGSLPCGASVRKIVLVSDQSRSGFKTLAFSANVVAGRLDPARACYFFSIGVMRRSFLATFQLP